MTIESWARVSPGMVDNHFAREFIARHNLYGAQNFDLGRVTTREHLAALREVESLYGRSMDDGGLDWCERRELARLMGSTNEALVDADADNRMARLSGGRYGFDPGYYEPGERSGGRRTESGTSEPRTSDEEGVHRTEDGRIVFDEAPSREDVRGGAVYRKGQKGDDFKPIQQNLLDGGYYGKCADDGEIDGMYGDRTEAAVRRWQGDHGFEQTGTLNDEQYQQLRGDNTCDPEQERSGGSGGSRRERPSEVRRRSYGVEGSWDDDCDRRASSSGRRTSDEDADGGSKDKRSRVDLFAGYQADHSIKDVRGRKIAEGESVGAGLDAEYKIVDGKNFNVKANTYVGGEATVGDGAAHGKAGLYAGVDAEVSGGFDLRYFGMDAKGSAGVGGGAQGEVYAANRDGRVSVGGAAKAGKGFTLGLGGGVWFDYGKVADDASAAWNWSGRKITEAGDAVVEGWNGIDWGHDD